MDSNNHLDIFLLDECCWEAGGVIEKPHYIVVVFSMAFDRVATRSIRATKIVEYTART